jgi:hypothetical protein
MVAVGVTGGVLATVLSGFSLAFGILRTVREDLRAIQILQEKLETIRLYSWEQIQTPGFVPSSFTASLNLTNQNAGTIYTGAVHIGAVPFTESYSSNLVQVEVEVNWNSGNVPRHRKMTTYVSRYGLQNYIY